MARTMCYILSLRGDLQEVDESNGCAKVVPVPSTVSLKMCITDLCQVIFFSLTVQKLSHIHVPSVMNIITDICSPLESM